MPNEITIRAGTLTATYTFPGTNAQFAAILQRFARSRGISVEGTNQENLQSALDFLVKYIWLVSKAQQQVDEQAANQAAIQAKVEADNPL